MATKKKAPKMPKKPKRSAPLSAWKRYDERVKERAKKIAMHGTESRQKLALIKKYGG